LLIHLFTRSRSRIIPFSTLRFLLELRQQKIRKLKLRQLLLLLVRMLIVLALVLGFARPTCRSHSAGASSTRAETTAVLILDNSSSMGRRASGHTLFEQAAGIATELIDAFQPGDEVYLVTTTDTTLELSHTSFHDFALLKKQIRELPLDARATRFDDALAFSDRLLTSSYSINKELYLIADLQRSGFSPDSLRKRLTGIRRYALPVKDQTLNNLSCIRVQLTSAILQKDKLLEGAVSVRNTGDIRQSNRLVQIVINGKQVAQSAVHLEPGAGVDLSWNCVLDQSGFLSGYAQLEEDDWREDNRSYFCFTVAENIRVALAGAETPDGYFLQTGLRPDADRLSPFLIDPVKPDQLAIQPLETYDVVILCNVAALSQETVDWLMRFVDSGRGLMLVLGTRLDLKSYNQGLHSRLGLPLFSEVMGPSENQQTSFSLGKADLQHPIFSGLFEPENAHLGNPNFHFAVKCLSTPSMSPVIQYSSGDPFLYEVRRASGAVLVYTTGFDDRLTDLPYRALFAPLIHRSVTYLNSAGRSVTAPAITGNALRFLLPAVWLDKPLMMQRPDQSLERTLLNTHGSAGPAIEYAHTDQVGIYRLMAEERTVNQWAVNLPEQELDLRTMDSGILKSHYDLHVLETAGSVAESVRQQRIGREWWRYFLLAGLALMLVEMALYYEKSEE